MTTSVVARRTVGQRNIQLNFHELHQVAISDAVHVPNPHKNGRYGLVCSPRHNTILRT